MKIIITGAGGLVGSALAGRFARAHEVIALRRAELDVTDGAAARRLLLAERPRLVVNCAVLGVDECERDPDAARAVNEEGPRRLAAAAHAAGAFVIHFSSNYVFGGDAGRRAPYTTEDEPRPINVYGLTKLAGERAVCAAAPGRSYIVRTSWVFGPGKASFLADAHRELSAGRTVRAITDTRASATYVFDLARRVGEILAHGRPGVYHVVNAGVCSHHEFAREAARLVGLDEAEAARLVEPVGEGGTRRAAPRPRHTPMRCLLSEALGLALRNWRAALAAHVAAKP